MIVSDDYGRGSDTSAVYQECHKDKTTEQECQYADDDEVIDTYAYGATRLCHQNCRHICRIYMIQKTK